VPGHACEAAARRAALSGPSRWVYAMAGAALTGLVWLVVHSRAGNVDHPDEGSTAQGGDGMGRYRHLEGYSSPSPIGGLVVPAQPLPVLNVSP